MADHNFKRLIVFALGIITVFTFGYLYLTIYLTKPLSNLMSEANSVLGMETIKPAEILRQRVFPDADRSHKCFKLFSNTSYFRSVISSNKIGHCRLITHAGPKGRVGNQMFQVAAVIGIASRLDMIPVINIKKCPIVKYFNFPNTINSDVGNVTMCNEKGYGKFSDCPYSKKNVNLRNIIISGFRQSWKYFNNATTYLRKVFAFKESYIDEARLFIANSSVSGHDNICIHVRRGDFLNPQKQANGRIVPDADFYNKAMQFYRRTLKGIRFIVLSDDIKWCRNNIKDNVTFSPYSDPGIDLAIMSLCDHVVVSAGTFGWWGAWLSKGTVVYFHGFPKNGSKLSRGFDWHDYYPPNWIKL